MLRPMASDFSRSKKASLTVLVLSAATLLLSCTDKPSAPQVRPSVSNTVSVRTSALNASPKIGDFVIAAQNSVRMQTGGLVVSGGDVCARGSGTGPFLSGNVAIDLSTGVQIQTSRNVIADSVRLGTGVVTGDIQTNHLTPGTGGSHGGVTALVPLPALPAVASVTAGTTNLTVATGATVTASAFNYATVTIGTGSTLRLPAGTYQLKDVSMSSGARLEASGPVQIRIANRLAGTSGAFIGPQSGVSLTAKDIRVEVSGINGTTGAITATPKSVAFSSGGSLTCLMLAPNGTLQFATGMVAKGAFMAKDVDAAGSGAQIVFQDGFANPCTAASCDDNNPCTNDVCGTSGCTHSAAANGTSCSDGNSCTQTDVCQAGVCTGANPKSCAPSDQCHIAGSCNPSTGTCSNPIATNGASCNDNDACTQTDACQAGVCTGANPRSCAPPDQCHIAGSCNPSTGTCSNPIATNGASCNDNDACTQTDACQSGVCTGGNPKSCAPSDQCHIAGTCNSSTGACSNPIATNGASCNDNDACTQTDACQSGVCTGTNPKSCAPSDQCHIAGACAPATGVCSNPVKSDGAPCDDGNACTSGDVCAMGACAPGNLTCASIAVTIDAPANAGPQMTTTLGADRAAAVPGDLVTFTSNVTNTGIQFDFFFGSITVKNNGSTPFVIQGYQQSLEYFSLTEHVWKPFAKQAFDATGQPIVDPQVQALQWAFLFPNDADGVTYAATQIVGTTIAPGSTASWYYRVSPFVPADVAAVVFNHAEAGDLRNVIRLDVPGGQPAATGQASFASALATVTGEITSPAVSLTFGGTNIVVPLASGLTTPLALGQTRIFSAQISAPTIAPRDPNDTDESYRRTLAFDVAVGYDVRATAFGGGALSDPAPAGAAMGLGIQLPIVSALKSGPAQGIAGLPVPYIVSLQNDGNTDATAFAFEDSVDDAPIASTTIAPPTLPPSASATTTLTAASPVDRPTGPMTDVVAVSWHDRNGNIYGPTHGSFSTNLLPGHPEGYLTLSGVIGTSQPVGSPQSLTITALDGLGHPVANVVAHLVITGVNPTSVDLTTAADGTASFSYDGPNLGHDAVKVSAAINGPVVQSNTLDIVWVSSVGVPCTGRTTPLDALLVIDGSPSMFNGNTVGAAEIASDRFIDNLDLSRDRVGAVLFSGEAQLYAPLTDDGTLAKGQINAALEGFANACNGICAGGSNFADAFAKALAELQGSRHRSTASPLLIFVSDGGNTGADPAPQLALLKAAGIKIVTIGVGPNVDSLVMRGIASSPGDYFYSPTSSDLTWVYESITQQICRNRAPLVRAGGDQGHYSARLPEIVTLNGEVHDDGPPGDSRVTSEWSLVTGPAPVAFTDATSPVTEALFTEPGTYVLRLTATDGFLTTADDATINIDPAPSLASATLLLSLNDPGPVPLGTNAIVRAVLRDGGGAPIPNFVVSFAVSGVNTAVGNASTDATGTALFSYAGARVGSDRIDATAIGGTETLAGTPAFLQWNTPSSGQPALTQGWVGFPIHQSTISGQVGITLGTDVTLTSGTVSYWPMNHPDLVRTLTTSAHGSPGDVIATLDTTTLSNGPYVVQVEGTNTTGTTQTSLVAVNVSGDYKPGRVVVAIEDFKLPLPGLSLAVGRKYDSLERGKVGDFGHGWSLTIGHPDLEADPAHNVTLTEPGGRRVTFTFSAVPFTTFFHFLHMPVYTPEPGVFGSLTADGCELLVVNDGRLVCFEDDLEYTPTTYTYTDAYGRVFKMSAGGVLKTIKDLQGNTLTFTPAGITSSTSGIAVQFQRDTAGRITRIVAPRTDSSTQNQFAYEYDAAGDLTLVTPPGEFQTFSHTYDADHLLLRSVDGRGNPARVSTYDTDGRLLSDTDALGRVTQYSYDIATRVTRTTNPDTGIVTQTFDARGLLLSETDPLGRTMAHQYDANRNEISRTNAQMETTTFTYDTNGNQTSATNARGDVTRTSFNQYGQPVSATDAAGNVTTLVYDDRFLPTQFSDSLGTMATFTSSTQGLPLSVTDAAGQTSFFGYDVAGNITTKTDRLGRTTRNTYDGLGHVLTVTDSRGAVTSYTYNPRGTRRWMVEAMGQWTRYDYDQNDTLLREYRPFDPRSTGYAYDATNHLIENAFGDNAHVFYTRDFRGNKLTETDEAGRITTYTYDLAGQLTKTTYPDSTFTTNTYDSLGRLESATDERGGVTAYEYEVGCGCADRITKVTDALGRATLTGYDALGRRTSVTDPAGHRTDYVYDARSHLIETHHPDGGIERDSFDTRGRRITHTDQTGAITAYGYDAEGQLTSVTDAGGNVTRYGYDFAGNLASVRDANGHVTAFEYDLSRRKTKRTLPLGQWETFGYDEVANIVSHMDFRGKTTTMLYDARSRLLSRTPDASLGEPAETFTYNVTGTRSAMTDGSGVSSYSYDQRNRMLTKASSAGTLTYTYDPTGNVATMRSSNANGTSVDYAWDAANQLVSVTDNRIPGGLTTVAYAVTGRPNQVVQPSGVTATYAYDAMNRITSLGWQKGAALASSTSTYNARGQRLTATELSGRQAAYGYDAVARLTSETVSGDAGGVGHNGVIDYSLDPTGNRLSRTSALTALPSSTTYGYDANDQLTTDAYDANGNTTASDGATYTYDFQNRLKSKNGGAGAAVVLTYNADGERVAKTVGGVTTRYLVDDLNPTGYLQVLEEVVGGAVKVRYTYGTMVVSQVRDPGAGAQTSFYGYDAHGNVTFLTDGAGAVTDTYAYDAWGSLVGQTGTAPQSRLYAGEEFDPDLGLINLRARQYSARTGRFLTADLLPGDWSSPTSRNPYIYANGNPVDSKDPLGLAAGAEEGSLTSIVAALQRTTVVVLQAGTNPTVRTILRVGQTVAVGAKLTCGFWTFEDRMSLMQASANDNAVPEPPPPYDSCEDPCHRPWNQCVESPLYKKWEGFGMTRCAACLLLCEGLGYWPVRLNNGHACIWGADRK